MDIMENIQYGIMNSKNPRLAMENYNFLLSLENEDFSKGDISAILAITESINNGSEGAVEYLQNRYGYTGGVLTEESLEKIQQGRKQNELIILELESMHEECA